MTVVAFNPYAHYGASLDNAATNVVLIAPSDTDELVKACKGLRVANTTGAAVTVAVVTVGGSTVTLTYPANSVVSENIVVKQVLLTGTSVGIIIHGLTD